MPKGPKRHKRPHVIGNAARVMEIASPMTPKFQTEALPVSVILEIKARID